MTRRTSFFLQQSPQTRLFYHHYYWYRSDLPLWFCKESRCYPRLFHVHAPPYITNICKASNFHLYRISWIRKYLTTNAMQTIVHSRIFSRISYCNSILYGLPKYQASRLQMCWNSAARLTSRFKKFDSITLVLAKLHWLHIPQPITFKILTKTYKALNGQAPPYISGLRAPYTPARSLRSSDLELLMIPRIHTNKYGGRTFECAAPILYNSLPISVIHSPFLPIFRSRLKTYLFQIAFPDCY